MHAMYAHPNCAHGRWYETQDRGQGGIGIECSGGCSGGARPQVEMPTDLDIFLARHDGVLKLVRRCDHSHPRCGGVVQPPLPHATLLQSSRQSLVGHHAVPLEERPALKRTH